MLLQRLTECAALCADESYPGVYFRLDGLQRIPFASALAHGALYIAGERAYLVFAKTGSDEAWWEHILQWCSNLDCQPYDPDKLRFGHRYTGQVHRGFASGLDSVWQDIEAPLVAVARDLPVTITGYSRGGALASLAAARYRDITGRALETFTFAAPKVGDSEFCFNHPGLLRVENGSDLVPFLAPGPLMQEFLRAIPLISRLAASNGTIYEHCGRLVFITWDGDIHLVDGFTQALLQAQRWGRLTAELVEFIDHLLNERRATHPWRRTTSSAGISTGFSRQTRRSELCRTIGSRSWRIVARSFTAATRVTHPRPSSSSSTTSVAPISSPLLRSSSVELPPLMAGNDRVRTVPVARCGAEAGQGPHEPKPVPPRPGVDGRHRSSRPMPR